jgi:hexosaminidase
MHCLHGRTRPIRVASVLFGVIAMLSALQPGHAQRIDFKNTLMPEPVKLSVADGTLAITPGLTLTLRGANNPLLEQAAVRMLNRLETQTGVQLDKGLQAAGGVIDVSVEDTSSNRPALSIDESYTLDIADGKVQLKAKTIFGAMYGFETLLQLVEPADTGFAFPAVHIADAPRFPWRGLMLDPGRHFLPVDEVLRTLDGMAAVKLNVLHWHLTEDQGFRIESQRFPRLHPLGSDGQYYTQQQVREIVQYAATRGIRVVPEFDMPGHSTTWFIGYPELASQPGPYHVAHENGIHNPAFDPTRESTFRFLDSFFGEMAELFPDEFVHIGGDESNGKDWLANPAIVRFMHQHNMPDTKALQAYFNQRVQVLLKKHGKQMVGWDEILHADLAPDVVVQNWHGIEFLVNGARQGHRGLLSKPFYLDHMYSAGDMYSADPVPADAHLSEAEAKLILGGEACMWGEQVTGMTADSRIWPRAAAVAERFWSPADKRDVDDMYRRLDVTSLRLDALGVTHISGPQRGLRQLAGSEAGAANLELLQSVLQPVDFHVRASLQHTSPLTPIGRFVDFTRPDPPAQHDFRVLVDAYLHDGSRAEHEIHKMQLERLFHAWINTAPTLEQQGEDHPLVAEMRMRYEQLPRLGMLGIEAIGMIEAHRAASPEWSAAQTTLITEAAEHVALTDFVVLGPLKDLVAAAAHR